MQYNKQSFFREILCVVFGMHVALLIILFVCDTGKFHQERFVINTDTLHATIVFMPLKKRVEQQPITKKGGAKIGKDRKVISYSDYQKKVASAKKKPVPAVKKKVTPVIAKKDIKPTLQQAAAKKPVLAPKPAAKKAPTVVKTEIKKPVISEKKIEPAKLQEKIGAKPVEKVPAPEIKKIEKVVPEKEKKQEPVAPAVVVEHKAVPALPEPVPSKPQAVAVEQQTVQPESVVPQSDGQHAQDDDEDDLGDISFVGSHDLEMIEIKEQIRAQVAQHYKPPVGISKKAVCQLAVIVGKDGKANTVMIKKGSGSLANDMCARAALLKITFPKEVIGKEIIVELGQ